MIRVHLTEEALEELGQVLVQMEGPHEIPHRVQSLKDEGNKSFKKGVCAWASGLYKHVLEILCINCIVTEVDDDVFNYLAITLNLNLADSELKQGQRAKAALGLCNIRQALCDLRKANRIDPNNIEIIKELQKIRRIHSQGDEKHREVHNTYMKDDSSTQVETIEFCIEGDTQVAGLLWE
ncbi:hypothetical protein Cgig2_001236 [Carnegiea gigantea]|uniref:Uncharacterized protein n=1 Tax=Carnegiea gigantea TaxID=171969 RepID=A0A9Q1K051_9CARY|nr:hypothetical protein Cgig2_001236 [Carnegiea gigantea]